MRLRFRFLLPARVWLALLLAAPMAIVCVYSALTRGDAIISALFADS